MNVSRLWRKPWPWLIPVAAIALVWFAPWPWEPAGTTAEARVTHLEERDGTRRHVEVEFDGPDGKVSLRRPLPRGRFVEDDGETCNVSYPPDAPDEATIMTQSMLYDRQRRKLLTYGLDALILIIAFGVCMILRA